jgi:hypothetical protein
VAAGRSSLRDLLAAIATVLALVAVLGYFVITSGHRAYDDCVSYQGLVSLPSGTTTDWAWQRLEWECVFTDHRTGDEVRVDIDDARREIARH